MVREAIPAENFDALKQFVETTTPIAAGENISRPWFQAIDG
jgi:L-alanine-DL-glutamate epimerase-like enolase superfamily enzyme